MESHWCLFIISDNDLIWGTIGSDTSVPKTVETKRTVNSSELFKT